MEENVSEDCEKKIRIMRSLPFFSPFTDKELYVILQTSVWLKKNSGDIVVHEGDAGRTFFVILKGSVCIQRHTGRANLKKPILCLRKGQCFGEVAVVTGQPRTADAVAEDETFILKMDADVLDKETDSLELRSIQLKFYKIFSSILASRLVLTDDLLIKASMY
ncbi:MAG: cyclic nucleotide-binding domain-containing protein [Nitrospirae bacterium]|nr:cyclic nucleotide-binding domain-containing protein [Nitrospirota bacterium]